MVDKIQKVIDGYLGREVTEPDEIDDVIAEYSSMHASERLERQRRAASPRRAGLTRRPTSLTVMSDDSAMRAVQSTLSEDERLVISADGQAIEIVGNVEEDEEVEGEVILRD